MRVSNTGRIPIKLWLDDIEDGAFNQAFNLSNLPFAYKWIAIMPDSHQGYGMPIGAVLATQGVIVPNAVGVDIGCGMIAVRTNLKEIDTETLKKIMGSARKLIPVGFDHHKVPQAWEGFYKAPDIQIIQQQLPSARKQLGTLGGGNHFIEIQKGDDGFIWLMIHSGSRNFGYQTAKVYHRKAINLCEKWYSNVPDKDLSFLPIESEEGGEYYKAMKYCLDFAQANRECMLTGLLNAMADFTDIASPMIKDVINIHHNYAAFENHYKKNVLVHRKGATCARLGQKGIIPGSMGTASYITEGLGNSESFTSCSHGAGRKMSRKAAKQTLNLKEEQAKMGGIVHGLRNTDDLDEAPGSYKDIDVVMENQKDLTKILVKLRPLASIKG